MKKILLSLIVAGLSFCISLPAHLALRSSQNIKIVVFVPEPYADAVREAMASAGAGRIGNYKACSVTTKVSAHFHPLKEAHPYVGTIDALQTVEEIKIEAICHVDRLENVLLQVKKVHPYEEIGYDLYPVLEAILTETHR